MRDRTENRDPRIFRGRKIGQSQQGGEPHLGVVVIERTGGDDHPSRLRRARQYLQGVSTDARRRMLECGNRGRCRLRIGPTQLPQTVQRPQRMDRTDVQADFVHRPISGQRNQFRDRTQITVFDKQSLGVFSPQHRGMLQRLDQLFGRRVSQCERLAGSG